MSKQKQSEPKSTTPDELTNSKKPADVQLNEEDLGKVSGGISITKSVDKTSPL